MTKTKTTKRALLTSVLSMMLCMAMLVGSTFAWFTDSVTSGANRIVAGNLDVELYYNNASTDDWKNASAASDANPNFFVDKEGNDILWEPGVMAVTQFKVANKGSLALKYMLTTKKAGFNTLNGLDLSDVIKFAVIENGDYTSREQILALDGLEFVDFTGFTAEGHLLPIDNKENEPTDKVFTVVAYWAPNVVDDNLYNVNNGQLTSDNAKQLYINIEIQLVAGQYNYEKDSFDENYDEACQILGGHDVDAWTETKAATCEKAGEKTGTCNRCGENITEDIPALGHTWGSSYALDLTDFSKHVKKCERCNKKQEGSEQEHIYPGPYSNCTECQYSDDGMEISSYADVTNVTFDFTNHTATGSFTITFGEQVQTYEFAGQVPTTQTGVGKYYSFEIELNGREYTLYFNVVEQWSDPKGWYVELA